jgi:hypothetical protein
MADRTAEVTLTREQIVRAENFVWTVASVKPHPIPVSVGWLAERTGYDVDDCRSILDRLANIGLLYTLNAAHLPTDDPAKIVVYHFNQKRITSYLKERAKRTTSPTGDT